MKTELYYIEYQLPQTLDFIKQYFSKNNKLSEQLNERKHRLTDSAATYRIINYWEKEGLLTDSRTTVTGWRKYSLMDMAWIKLLAELRKFGYPIEGLKQLKSNLIEKHPLNGQESFVYLEAYTALAIVQKIPIFINIMPNGNSILTTQREKRSLEENRLFAVNSHLCISLNHLLSAITNKGFYHTKLESQLTPEEIELLNTIRTGDFTSVNVRLKNGVIDMIDMTDSVECSEKIVNILRSNNYQNIEVVQKDGKVVSIKRTITRKLNKAK